MPRWTHIESMNFLKLILVPWLLVVMLGCQVDDGRPLKVATNLWPGYEPLYLAQYLGVFGKNVEIIQLSSATEVMRAMAHGNLDVAALTLDEAISLMAQGLELELVLVMDYSRGGDAVVTLNNEVKSLDGLRVGVENTALGAIVLSEALRQQRLGAGDIEVVNVSPDDHEKALKDGEVDAVVTFEPRLTRLLAMGGKVLFDTRQAPELVVDILVARKESLVSRPRQLKHLVEGYFEARRYMESHHSESQVFFSKRLKLEKSQLQQAFQGLYLPTLEDNKNWFSGQPSPYQNSFMRVLEVMQIHNLVKGSPQAENPPPWLLEVSG